MSVSALDAETHPTTGQLFLMSYIPRNGNRNDERTYQHKTMLRPRTYQDAVDAARIHFPQISNDHNIVFESNELQWCDGYRNIESDEWERPEVRNFVWKVLVTELVDTTVPNPGLPVKVYIVNPADTRPLHAKLRGRNLIGKEFVRSTTILEVKRHIGRAYGVQPTTFSLIRWSTNNLIGLGTDYMASYTDILCIGEICANQKIYLAIVWHGNCF